MEACHRLFRCAGPCFPLSPHDRFHPYPRSGLTESLKDRADELDGTMCTLIQRFKPGCDMAKLVCGRWEVGRV
jgi:hypothetical protein